MAAKKKGGGSSSTDAPMSPEDAIVRQANGNSNSDNVSIENVAEVDFEVHLHDLGISTEDIATMRRIDAHLEEVRRAKQ